jgi:hypothetical protein
MSSSPPPLPPGAALLPPPPPEVFPVVSVPVVPVPVVPVVPVVPPPSRKSSLLRRSKSSRKSERGMSSTVSSEYFVGDVVAVVEEVPPVVHTRYSSPSLSPMDSKRPMAFHPPTLRPQHVYAPVAPLGMLSLGVLSKHKREGMGGIDGEKGGTAREFKKMLSGKCSS